eukprot:jgi/Tetstr1/447190/TSEL_034627.t1
MWPNPGVAAAAAASASAVMLLLDFVWFAYSVPRVYSRAFSRATRSEWSFSASRGNVAAAALAYAVLVILATFAVAETLQNTALRGALLGALTYAVYNFTNLATFGTDVWGWTTALVDIPWGAFVVASGASAAFLATSARVAP